MRYKNISGLFSALLKCPLKQKVDISEGKGQQEQ